MQIKQCPKCGCPWIGLIFSHGESHEISCTHCDWVFPLSQKAKAYFDIGIENGLKDMEVKDAKF